MQLSLAGLGVPGIPLNLLRQLPLRSVQLDGSFVRDLTLEGADAYAAGQLARNLIQLVVALGRNLGIAVVAKGIATPLQRALLRELGCDEGQGPLFGAPYTTAAPAAGAVYLPLPT